jgi:hypothetical protein
MGYLYGDMDNIEVSLVDDTTVNLTSSMTTAEIQSVIDSQPKNLKGYDLTFKFADGTYNLNTSLLFYYFRGGRLILTSTTNPLRTSLASDQGVHLSCASTPVVISDCDFALLSNLHCVCTATGGFGQGSGVSVFYTTSLEVAGCYTQRDGITGDFSIQIEKGANAYIYNTYIRGGIYGIYGRDVLVESNNNPSLTTNPAYGLAADRACFIAKTSTQPTGSTSNETTGGGGLIR